MATRHLQAPSHEDRPLSEALSFDAQVHVSAGLPVGTCGAGLPGSNAGKAEGLEGRLLAVGPVGLGG